MSVLQKHITEFRKSPRPVVKGLCIFLGCLRRGPTVATNSPAGAEICACLNHIMSYYRPHKYTSIVINYNSSSSPHQDKKNSGTSTITAVGDYSEGGNLLVWPDGMSNPPRELHLRGRMQVFDGSHFHSNTPYQGNRWSIIFFTYASSLKRIFTRGEVQMLVDLGFDLPRELTLETKL